MFKVEDSTRPSARPRAANMGRTGPESDSELGPQADADLPDCEPGFRPAVSPPRQFDRPFPVPVISTGRRGRRSLSTAAPRTLHRAGKISPLHGAAGRSGRY